MSFPKLIERWRVLGVCAAVLSGPAAAVAQQTDSIATIVAQVSDAVCGTDVVLLGELGSHGEARGFQVKAGIIQRLVERCGFDAVYFEAPIYDFIGFQEAITNKSAEPQQLDNAIGRFWLNRELADFRKFLFERSKNGLVIAGLDDQVSATSQYARRALPELFRKASPAEAANECVQVVERNLNWTYDAQHPFDAAEQARLRACARSAADAKSLTATQRLMLESFASYAGRQANLPQATSRDEVMARNAQWHIARMPAHSKVVIWTATVHAARTRGQLAFEPTGSFLVQHARDRVAAIGFTAYEGQSSMAGRPPQPLAAMPAGSLESAVLAGNRAWMFLDAAALKQMGAVPSRLLGKTVTDDWSGYFDGVVVIRNEVPPTFDAR